MQFLYFILIPPKISNNNGLTDHKEAYYVINNFILCWEIGKGTLIPKINELKINYYLEGREAI